MPQLCYYFVWFFALVNFLRNRFKFVSLNVFPALSHYILNYFQNWNREKTYWPKYPAKTRCLSNAVLMLGQRSRQLPSIKTTSYKRIVFAWQLLLFAFARNNCSANSRNSLLLKWTVTAVCSLTAVLWRHHGHHWFTYTPVEHARKGQSDKWPLSTLHIPWRVSISIHIPKMLHPYMYKGFKYSWPWASKPRQNKRDSLFISSIHISIGGCTWLQPVFYLGPCSICDNFLEFSQHRLICHQLQISAGRFTLCLRSQITRNILFPKFIIYW